MTTPHSDLHAVIDIGSNSVRLVLYRIKRQHAQAIFNERASCSLGVGLVKGGMLNANSMQHARDTVARFRQLLHARRPSHVTALATAAIRVSANGDAFKRELETILGHPIRILSGKEEACYASLGVALTTYNPHGLVVDLGGGSMELSSIAANGTITPHYSVPTGVLGFRDMLETHGEAYIVEYITSLCKEIALPKADVIYTVGGSFRAIATLHMKQHKHPLHILQDYRVPYKALSDVITFIKQYHISNESLPGISRKRQTMVHPAALILKTLMNHCGADTMHCSSAGIREGALADELITPDYDPLMAMLHVSTSSITDDAYRIALHHWITRPLPINAAQTRLVRAFCLISDRAMQMHPDYRADYAFEHMIANPSYGLLHEEHVTLALALYHRYRTKLKLTHPAITLLDTPQRAFASAIGQLAHMAYAISAGSASLLNATSVQRDANGCITIITDGSQDITLPARAQNWCDGLGDTINAFSNCAK